jgi:hypothetical protein
MVCLMLCLFGSIRAQTDGELLAHEAAQAQLAGDFPTAIAQYEAAMAAGFQNVSVLHNLGVAHYEVGEPGLALLYLLRARDLDPRSATNNAAIARIRAERIDVQLETVSFIDRLADSTADQVTITELGWAAGIGWSAWWSLLIFLLVTRRWRRVVAPVTGLLGVIVLIGALLFGSRLYTDSQRPPAVVVVNAVDALSGPGEQYLNLFRIYAAAEVRIIDRRPGWVHFALPDGREGWVVDDAIEGV